MKKVLKKIFSRMVFIILALALQLVWLFLLIFRLGQYYAPVSIAFCLLSILTVIWIINSRGNPSIKMAWIVPIMIFPVFGGVVYLMAGGKQPRKKMKALIRRSSEKIQTYIPATICLPLSAEEIEKRDAVRELTLPTVQTVAIHQFSRTQPPLSSETQMASMPQITPMSLILKSDVLAEISAKDPHVGGQCRYLVAHGFPVYQNTNAKYFRLGEEQFEAMLYELEKAEHFIFMEYFIIEEGRMWDSLLDILIRKAKAGLDVRIIFDDVGCMNTLPFRYEKYLESQGIQALAFNPFRPVLSAIMNNRDHRKMTIIDGHTGFTGGINLADEYINERQKYGHWKDTGVLLKGEAVWTLTLLFLEMWNAFRPTDTDLKAFHPHAFHPDTFEGDGYIQPYGDTPLDNEVLAENVYLNIVNQAKRSLDIYTPYLIIDHEMMSALCLAAKRGVRVRIVLPGIPESPILERLAKSHYPELLENGVEIHEYIPGFIHAKCFVCDGEIATVGTINMDYRSLYLHFECGCYFYKSSIIEKIEADFDETLKQCHQVRRRQCSRPKGILIGFYDAILRLFAPLM